MSDPIPFIDLQAQRRRLMPQLDEAIARVLEHGKFVMGPEVAELERQLEDFTGARHCVTCSSGTDALVLSLVALGIGSGDGVLVPTFTFAATAEAVALVGATPIFVDSDPDTYNMDPAGLAPAVQEGRRQGLVPRAVVPVDLFGLPADYAAIDSAAQEHGLTVVADAAQSFGAQANGRSVGTLATVTTTSFFPAKPLGCYGDGGAVFTDDDEAAAMLRSLRVHGQGRDKYENVRVGLNARLDTLQAAVLLVKLGVYPLELVMRERVATRYSKLLGDLVEVPQPLDGEGSAWAQYTIRLDDRDRVAAVLKEWGIPTAIYYPVPLHRQPAYQKAPRAAPQLPVAEELAATVLSLPMHPYLDEDQQDRVVDALREALAQERS